MANSARERDGLDGERFMTKREVSELFRVSERTVDRWRSRGLFHTVKVGHFQLFDRDEVLDVLNGMSSGDRRYKFAKDGRLVSISMSANCE